MNKDCLTKLETICSQLGEDLSSERCKMLKEQMKKCPGCCAYIDTIKKTVELYHNLPDEEISFEVHRRLWKILPL